MAGQRDMMPPAETPAGGFARKVKYASPLRKSKVSSSTNIRRNRRPEIQPRPRMPGVPGLLVLRPGSVPGRRLGVGFGDNHEVFSSWPDRNLRTASDQHERSPGGRGSRNHPKAMNVLVRLVLTLSLVGATTGCTSYLVQQQGKFSPGHYPDCPSVYTYSRMELASIEWAFSGDSAPPDACLRHYYPKATKDPFYGDANRWMTPLYVLSLPMDVVVSRHAWASRPTA